MEKLWEFPKGSPESDELEVLVTFIELFEKKHFPIDFPDPIEAIKFRLEQMGKDPLALIGVIGPWNRVYEVMRGDRRLSLNMIRNLYDTFGIPAEVLIQPVLKRYKSGRPLKGVRFDRRSISSIRPSGYKPSDECLKKLMAKIGWTIPKKSSGKHSHRNSANRSD